MVSHSHASPKFWDRLANKYSRTPIADEASYEVKLEKSQSLFTPDMRVLEFGCGTGSTALIHAPHVAHIRAIDVSPRMIEIANEKRAQTALKNVDFEVNTIETLEALDGSYDVIMGMSILHLLNDKEAVLAKVQNLLKPGGVFISSTTCLAENLKFLKYLAPITRALRLLPAIRVFTPSELVESIKAAGFEIEDEWQPERGKAVFIVARKPL